MTYAQMTQYKSFLPDLLFFPGQRAVSKEGTGPGPVRDAQQRYFGAFAAAGIRPESSHLVVWDPTMVAMEAVRRLGVHATALQIRDYIENLHGWLGINGAYDFGDAEHRGIGTESVVIFRWDPAHEDFVAASRPGGTPALK